MERHDYILDIEADNLLDEATRVWCIVMQKVDTKEFEVFIPKESLEDSLDTYNLDTKENEVFNFHPLEEFKPFFKEKVNNLIGHNIINYDSRCLLKLGYLDEEIEIKRLTDTMVLSQITSPSRQGGHSLDSWGMRFEDYKGKFNDFSQYSHEMLDYCIQDVRITNKLYKYMLSNTKDFSKFSIRLEHMVRRILDEMQADGFAFDQERAHNLYVEISAKCEELEKKIKEEFPPEKKYYKALYPRISSKGQMHGQDANTLNKNLWDLKVDEEGKTYYHLYDLEEFNLRSTKMIVERMNALGWQPSVLNEPSATKIREEALLFLHNKGILLPHEKEMKNFIELIGGAVKDINDIESQFLSLGSPSGMSELGFEIHSNYYYSIMEMERLSKDEIVKFAEKHGFDVLEVRGSPKVCEENFETLPSEAPSSVKLIAEWFLLDKRKQKLDEWFRELNPKTGCIHGKIFGCGAHTHRMTHRNPNTANNPAVVVDENGHPVYGAAGLYATDMRACWVTRDKKNRCLVGVDLSGIQLRAFAHYAKNKEYAEQILSGDIHAYNRDILSKLCEEYKKLTGVDCDFLQHNPKTRRGNAKTFIYGYLFGAGNRKVGEILGYPVNERMDAGKFIKDGFVKSISGLEAFKKDMKKWANQGYMVGLDGRLIAIPSEHQGLSIALQSFEAIVFKYSLALAYKRLKELSNEIKLVGAIHDESQIDTPKHLAREVGEIVVKCMNEAGEFFKTFIRIDGEASEPGISWADTH